MSSFLAPFPMVARPPGMCLRIAAAALLLPMMAACEDAPGAGWEFEGQVSRSSVWEYHDGVDEPLCPTLLALLDDHARTIGGKIGLTVEENRPLRYYRFGDKAALASVCGPGACAERDAVLTEERFHAHEQAHTYVFRAWNSPSVGLLEEGEATALSCDPAYTPQRGVSPREALGAAADWRPFLYLWGNSVSGYSAAGFWITYLARQYGWPKVAELHRRVLPGLSADDLAVEFARVFPISMDQAWSAALSGNSPPCDDGWICRGTSMSPGDVVRADCDGELHGSIEVTGQPGIVVTFRGGSLRLHDCGGDAMAPGYELPSGRGVATTHWASLPPGTYAMGGRPTEIPTEVSFISYLPSPMFASSCEQAGTVTLKPGECTFVDVLPGTIDGSLRIDGGDAQYHVAFHGADYSSSGGAVLCESCDPGAPCVAIPNLGAAAVTIGAGAVLRLQGVQIASQPSGAFGEILFYPVPPADGGT